MAVSFSRVSKGGAESLRSEDTSQGGQLVDCKVTFLKWTPAKSYSHSVEASRTYQE